MTCAHVVAFSSSQIDLKQEEKPTEAVEINFPVLEMGRKLKAEVAFWYPYKKGETLQDIAVLRLPDTERLPDGAAPVKFIEIGSRELWGHRFRAFGFPKKAIDGEWATGELRGRVGRGRIQLEGVTETGLRLEKGFSGTPIWDEDLQGVVGMAVAEDGERPEAKVAFMTPTDVLLRAGDLAEVCQVDGRVGNAIAIFRDRFETRETEIRWAYYRSLPRQSIPLSSGKTLSDFPETPAEMIRNLDGRRVGEYALLDRLFGYLLLHLRDLDEDAELRSRLETWLERHGPDVGQLLPALKREEALRQQPGESESCLLIGVLERSGSFNLKAWLIEDVQNYSPQSGRARIEPLTDGEGEPIDPKLQDLPRLINAQRKKVYDRALGGDAIVKSIHCFLPLKLIARVAPEEAVVEGHPVEATFGCQYEINVRFSERLSNDSEGIRRWRRKGKVFRDKLGEGADGILKPLDNGSLKKLYRNLQEADGVRLTGALREPMSERTMQILLEAGVPLALWLRQTAGEACGEAWGGVCSCDLRGLPERIKSQRADAWEREDESHIGKHVSLLWDDPQLVPPVKLLELSGA